MADEPKNPADILYPPKRGRPSLDPNGEPAVPLTLSLPPAEYAALKLRADAARLSVQDQLRSDLRELTRKK